MSRFYGSLCIMTESGTMTDRRHKNKKLHVIDVERYFGQVILKCYSSVKALCIIVLTLYINVLNIVSVTLS